METEPNGTKTKKKTERNKPSNVNAALSIAAYHLLVDNHGGEADKNDLFRCEA
jgi:hypothetical protein